MGMTFHVEGFRDMGEQFQRMMEVKEFCDVRKLSYPREVAEYFRPIEDEYGEDWHEESLTREQVEDTMAEMEVSARAFSNATAEGLEVDVAAIPVGCKTLRFFASW